MLALIAGGGGLPQTGGVDAVRSAFSLRLEGTGRWGWSPILVRLETLAALP